MTTALSFLQQFAQPWFVFLSEDPTLRLLQFGMLFVGVIVIFLVFFTTRDILLRTHSFWIMFFSIVLVALLPVIGFFLYLLIRPARTIKEREVEELLLRIIADNTSSIRKQPGDTKAGIVKKKPVNKKKTTPSEDLSL
ncbi:hypothetical protein COU75_02340 [Candidatus Peregrinibacteria bacterium CG10_big_fil_rev_8_21_14_0_10_42_8]|nr:MAG: hypothetical protein COU75_02340 [Candidatus Peregrinibacteria bacterium CG10_big_fil_rev_8_21_14_0_10_42_8]